MKPLAVLLLFTITLLAAPIPKQLKKKTEFDGVWEVQSLFIGNSEHKLPHPTLLVVNGRSMKPEDEKSGLAANDLNFVTSDRMGDIDYVAIVGMDKTTRLGIHELDGDTWRLCFNISPNNQNRPSKFVAHDGVFLYTLKRAEGK